MRAPFNTTVTLYDGPTTPTPGFPRVVGMPCRFIADTLFVDVNTPLSTSGAYFTCAANLPRGSTNTNVGGGIWQFDFGKADLAEFAAFPGVQFSVLRVELCTGQENPGDYWRASITQLEPAPAVCSDFYADHIEWEAIDDPGAGTLSRETTTHWSDGSTTLDADAPPAPEVSCLGAWLFKWNGVNYSGIWDGIGPAVLTADDASGWVAILTPTP